MSNYDAILLVAFGGPEKREDVMPFLENVTRGRNIPRERLLEVAEHYYRFEGRSPINQHSRELITALEALLAREGPKLPVYWGNRNWHPMLADTVRQMAKDGVRHAVAFVGSAFASYSSCRQYRDNLEDARAAAGNGAPAIDKLRLFFNHPLFLEAMADRVRAAAARLPEAERGRVRFVFTAHSIPSSMAAGCRYEAQLRDSCALTTAMAGGSDWVLAWQSRSGPPTQPWLEPDVSDYLRASVQQGFRGPVVIVPIGFTSDHIEVLWDLDHEVRETCEELGVTMVRASTVGTHPSYVAMIRELILERMEPGRAARFVGESELYPEQCGESCCPRPQRPKEARSRGV